MEMRIYHMKTTDASLIDGVQKYQELLNKKLTNDLFNATFRLGLP